VEHGRRGHGALHPLGGQGDVVDAAVRQKEKELLTAIAVDAFVCPSRPIEAVCDVAQGFVTGEMTVVVVVKLEVVDVEERDAVGTSKSERPGVGAYKILLHAAPVAEPGQSVGERLPEQFEVGLLELGLGFDQLAVQDGHALRGHQTSFDGEGVDRLDHVVIGPCAHTLQDLLGEPQTGDQNDVDIAAAQLGAHAPAQLWAIDPRHHPVGEQDVDLLRRQELPSARPILGNEAFMAQLGGRGLEQKSTGGAVVGDEDSHLRSWSRAG